VSAPDVASLSADLAAEHAAVDAMLAGLGDDGWRTPTPAPGWTISDQIGHLAYFDGAAALAITDPAGFEVPKQEAEASPVDFVEAVRAGWADRTGADLRAWWAAEHERLVDAARAADPDVRVPWFGPPMSLTSKLTARIMETWAHGQDVADALGRTRPPTDRLRHVAHIGVRARPFSYLVRGLPTPDVDIRVELTGPEGQAWEWGDPMSADRVSGDAEEFCLVVTQRRHLDDTSLRYTPGPSQEWLGIAQAFAGPPGEGRRAGQFESGTRGAKES